MPQKLDYYRFLGLSPEASVAQMEERCQELLRYLRGGAVPEGLRPRAKAQAEVVEEIDRSLGESESVEPGEVTLAEEEPVSRRGLGRRLWGPVGFAVMGILVGLVIVGGVLWGRQEKEPASPAATQEGQLSPQEFLAAHQARLAELEALIAKEPNNTDALFEIGETYMMGEQWEQAIRWFTKLLEIKPGVHAQTDIALAQMALGRYEESEGSFLKALEIDTTYLPLHYGMGYFYASKPNPDIALAAKHWQEVIRLAPDSDLAATARVHLEQLGLSTPTP